MINSFTASAATIEQCWAKHVKKLNDDNCLSFAIEETANKFYHSFEPWQKITINSTGKIYFSSSKLLKTDTITRKEKHYVANLQYGPTGLLMQGYGAQKLSSVTKKEFEDYLLETGRYTPVHILDYFYNHQSLAKTSYENNNFIASLSISGATVTLFINKTDTLVSKINILAYDDLYGDIISSYTYSDYEKLNGISFPKKVAITKLNGKITDEVHMSSPQIVSDVPDLLQKPDDFKWEEEEEEKTEISLEKYSDNIYFLYLKQPDTKSLLVEFADFLLVAEAPLSIANGELIIKTVKNIFPDKPIKYFTYGHFHSWYLGGIRPFVYEGSTIITRPQSKEYVEFIVKAEHKQNPDDLQKNPQKLNLEIINDSLTISDGNFEMKLYVIGEKSDHTNDFMIYYFPDKQLLFEDDLIWISKEGEPKKAGARQAGLYKAINDLNLDVKTIIQAWPVNGYGVKNTIPYQELEQTVNIK